MTSGRAVGGARVETGPFDARAKSPRQRIADDGAMTDDETIVEFSQIRGGNFLRLLGFTRRRIHREAIHAGAFEE